MCTALCARPREVLAGRRAAEVAGGRGARLELALTFGAASRLRADFYSASAGTILAWLEPVKAPRDEKKRARIAIHRRPAKNALVHYASESSPPAF